MFIKNTKLFTDTNLELIRVFRRVNGHKINIQINCIQQQFESSSRRRHIYQESYRRIFIVSLFIMAKMEKSGRVINGKIDLYTE